MSVNPARPSIGLTMLLMALTVLLVGVGCISGAASPTNVTVVLLPTPMPTPVKVPILMYHHVAPTAPSDQMQFNLTVTTADFCQQLDYLKSSGYATLTLANLFDILYRGAPLPGKPIILTFDDGYADAFTDAFPLLQAYRFKGTFAVVTGFVEKPGYLTWDQIRTMAAAGMEFAAHTVTHIDLNTSSDDTVKQQLKASKQSLEERLGKPVDFFVYPSGEPFRSGSKGRQQAVIVLLREAGYVGALLAGPYSLTQDPQHPFELNRVRVSGGESLAGFAASIGGPAPASTAANCPAAGR